MPCCSFCKTSSRESICSCESHFAFFGLSSTSRHHKKAQIMAGKPSRINIHLQPSAFIKYPDKMDIQRIVTGLPRIKNVLARERSDFVNHLLNKISIAGNTALSTTPKVKRIKIRTFTFEIIPVAVAQTPHSMSDQKINFFALFLDA